MAKKYNISSSSDMKRLGRDLEKALLNQARDAVKNQTYEIECPFCEKKFNARNGKNICPSCKETVKLDLKINF